MQLDQRLRIFAVAVLVLPLFGSAWADCELTEEYKKLRSTTYRELHEPLKACRQSVHDWYYWKNFSKCVRDRSGEHVGGGCAHVAGLLSAVNSEDLVHCEVLKPTESEFVKVVDEAAKLNGIAACRPPKN
jgi:hypothetical protein